MFHIIKECVLETSMKGKVIPNKTLKGTKSRYGHKCKQMQVMDAELSVDAVNVSDQLCIFQCKSRNFFEFSVGFFVWLVGV